jgi:hypothetical protein
MTQEQHDYEMGCAGQAQAEYEAQMAYFGHKNQNQCSLIKKLQYFFVLNRIAKSFYPTLLKV